MAELQLPAGSGVAPVLSPEEALGTFRLPAGYTIEIVAAEPLVREPVRIEFDPAGRLWVVEMSGYMTDIQDSGADLPIGRVVVLEDDDADGRMDRRTVFLDSLVLPRALAVLEAGVLVGVPPDLWLVRDTTGDLRADARELIRDDFGNPGGNVEHDANGFVWGIDNWLHTANWAGQLRLRGGEFDFRRTPSLGQWGISMDGYGRLYRNSNEDPLRADLVPAHYATRSPNLPSTRGVYERLTANVPVWPADRTPAVNRGYRAQTLRPDSTLAHYTAASSPTIYTGDQLPRELLRHVFIAEPAGNLVGRLEVSESDEGLPTAARVDEGTEFLASTDERFRPVYLANAPDGTLYVADMYRGIIQHRTYITGYLEEQIESRGLEQPIGLGRIYRIVHTSTRRGAAPLPASLNGAGLVETLSHPNGWHRITAQRLLVERGDRSVAPALRSLLRDAEDDRVRLHALWTLEGLGEADQEVVGRALADPSPHLRAAAIRIAEPSLAAGDAALRPAVMAMMNDGAPLVRRQLAASLGELPGARKEDALAEVALRHGADPVVADLVAGGVPGRELALLERLLGSAGPRAPTESVAPAVGALARAVLRGRDPSAVQALLGLATEGGRPRWQTIALLDAGRGANLPENSIELPAPPGALIALAESADSVLRQRASATALALSWPGKPRRTPPVRPLTDQEELRFAAGEEIFLASCAGCHQATGTGLPGVATSLVGSEWVAGSPAILTRIVVHGKEGAMLMPPVASAMADDEVAAVLTYVRRAWGNLASPVTAGAVAEVRGATMGRSAPWTEAELRALQ